MEVFKMKYRLFLVIFLSSVLNILLGTFLQISNVSIGWLVLYSGLFEAGIFLRLILFYGHIFIVFNALMYLLSSSQVSLKKNKLSS
ncbi:MAG: hypothetical protein DI581_11550 [Staphylococcus capitis]|nr:MAG: hypothetical protein DI581_11550 [Staphylococcus capitis]